MLKACRFEQHTILPSRQLILRKSLKYSSKAEPNYNKKVTFYTKFVNTVALKGSPDGKMVCLHFRCVSICACREKDHTMKMVPVGSYNPVLDKKDVLFYIISSLQFIY